MKRYSYILAAALLMISFSSCQKDYTCQCVDYAGNKDLLKVHDTKKKAKDQCASYTVGTAGQPKSLTCKLL
jgi:hypothetical protein